MVLTAAGTTAFAGGKAALYEAELERANRSWKGARCRLRFPVKIKAKTDGQGWSPSRIMLAIPGGKGPDGKTVSEMTIRFRVSDRRALERLLVNGTVPAGTAFISDGWELKHPEKKKGLTLQLRFVDAPGVRARWEFFGPHSAWLGMEIKGLERAEPWMRINAFALEAADEQLVAVALPPPKPAEPRPRPAPAPAVEAPLVETVYSPAIRIVAVSVQPPRVQRGSQAELIAQYVFEGVPPGVAYEILEKRIVSRGKTKLIELEERINRTTDIYTSSQSVTVPASAEPAVYDLEIQLLLGETPVTGSAIFEVY